MKFHTVTSCLFQYCLWITLLSLLSCGPVMAADDSPLHLSEPRQKEQFFEPERFSFTDSANAAKPVVQPHLAISHDTRENDVGIGIKQTTQRFHGEAGGKLNLLGDISLKTFAKVPVYTKESVEKQRNPDGGSSSEILKDTGRFSWRSELGIPVKKGVDLNFFYDNSTVGKVEKPGVEEREEKFGTRFIFQFK